MPFEPINPPQFPTPIAPYSAGTRAGDTVYVSGTLALGEGGSVLHPGDAAAQTRHVLETIRTTLEAAGASLADVVELTTFHATPKSTEEFRAEFARFAPIHHEYFPDHYPAWSAVGTTALLAKDAPVEMRAVAIRGSGKRPHAPIARPTPAVPHSE